MGFESSRIWTNVVYVVGIVVLLFGCVEFMISRAYVPYPNLALRTAVSVVLVIVGLVATLIGLAMRKIVRNVESKNAEMQRALYAFQEKHK